MRANRIPVGASNRGSHELPPSGRGNLEGRVVVPAPTPTTPAAQVAQQAIQPGPPGVNPQHRSHQRVPVGDNPAPSAPIQPPPGSKRTPW